MPICISMVVLYDVPTTCTFTQIEKTSAKNSQGSRIKVALVNLIYEFQIQDKSARPEVRAIQSPPSTPIATKIIPFAVDGRDVTDMDG